MSYESNTFNLSHKLFLFESGYDTTTGTNVGVGISPTLSNVGIFSGATYDSAWASGGKRTLCTTSTSVNTVAAALLTSAGPKVLGIRSVYAKVSTHTDISSSRIWSVWTETSAPGATFYGTATPVTGYFGFRYDTSASDTTWKLVVGKTSTGAQTVVDTGITVQTNTLYELQVDPISNEKFTGIINGRRFSIDAGTGNGLDTNAQLYWYTGITTLTSAQRAINWYHQYLVCG
jgi:hypothetical protein